MKRKLKRISVVVVGVVFVLLGFLGFALPFLQGFLFLAIGLMLLSITSPRLRQWLNQHTIKYPKIHTVIERVERWIIEKIGPLD